MKKILPYILIILVGYACRDGWSQNEKETYLRVCTDAVIANGSDRDAAHKYCKCMQEKTEKASPDVSDAGRITDSTRKVWAAECQK